MLEVFQVSSRKPTSHHIAVSIFLRAKVISLFFNHKTLGYQSPDSRSLSPATKVLSLPEIRLKPTRAKSQSLSSAEAVYPLHTGRPFEPIDILLSQKKDCQIFLDALNPDTDFSETGRKVFLECFVEEEVQDFVLHSISTPLHQSNSSSMNCRWLYMDSQQPG